MRRQKEFDAYVEALRVVFESEDDRFPLRVAMTRESDGKAVAWAIVVGEQYLPEAARMQLLAGIARKLLPEATSLPMMPMPAIESEVRRG